MPTPLTPSEPSAADVVETTEEAVGTPGTDPDPTGPKDSPSKGVPPSDPYLGSVQGRYRILRKIGEGGMGAVYLAVHEVIERKVAIKILSSDFARKPELMQRFYQEARAAARIGHENIVEVTDFGETTSGSVFFVMEYLEGRDLGVLIRESAPSTLHFSRVKNIAVQICKALGAAHAKQIIHRDLKPENVFLVEREGKSDFVKVLDFGIAKISNLDQEVQGRLTRTGMIFGTPEYMSPEQARGETPDHRVDIYALGCILYEMLTGSVPYAAESFMGVLSKHMFEPLELPSRRLGAPIPRELEETCLRAMEKDRERRFQSMQQVAAALEGELSPYVSGAVVAQINVGNSSRSYINPLAPPPPPQDYSLVSNSGQFAGAIPSAHSYQAMPVGMAYGTSGIMQSPLGLTPALQPGMSPRTTDETTQSSVHLPPPSKPRRALFVGIGVVLGLLVLLGVLYRTKVLGNGGHEPQGDRIEVTSSPPVTNAPPEPVRPAPPATLKITAPQGALVEVDDRPYGEPPVTLSLPINAGTSRRVRLKISKSGFETEARELELLSGQSLEQKIQLTAVPAPINNVKQPPPKGKKPEKGDKPEKGEKDTQSKPVPGLRDPFADKPAVPGAVPKKTK